MCHSIYNINTMSEKGISGHGGVRKYQHILPRPIFDETNCECIGIHFPYFTCEKDIYFSDLTPERLCELLQGFAEDGVSVTGDRVLSLNADGTCTIKTLNYTVDINVANIGYDPVTKEIIVTETDNTEHRESLLDLLCCTIVNDVTAQNCPNPLPSAPSTVPNPLPTAGSVFIDAYKDCTLYFTLNTDGSYDVVAKRDCCVTGDEVGNTDFDTTGDPATGITNYVNTNNITNKIIKYVGNGTASDPDYVWYVDSEGVVLNIESPSPEEECCPETSEIPATAFGDANAPTINDVQTWITEQNITAPALLYLIGDGTDEDPDWVWNVSHDGIITNIESPAAAETPQDYPEYTVVPAGDVDDNDVNGSVATFVGAGNITNEFIYVIGDGTEADPDYVYYVTETGVIKNIESPVCDRRYGFVGEHCYTDGLTCDKLSTEVVFREDFETPSDANQNSGMGNFLGSDLDISVEGQPPYWGQMYAEGIYRVYSAGYVPVGGPDPEIHFNWLDYAPFSSGYASFNLEPAAGVAGDRMAYANVDVEAGQCYTVRMKAKDTHTQAVIDANGISLSDIGLMVDGVIVGTTGPIGAGTQTDDAKVYDATFMATADATVEFALISNNADTNGNDVFIDWVEIVKSKQIDNCEKGTYRYDLECGGVIIPGTQVPVDKDGNLFTTPPTPCECPDDQVDVSQVSINAAGVPTHKANDVSTLMPAVTYIKRVHTENANHYISGPDLVASSTPIGSTYSGYQADENVTGLSVPFPSPDGYVWIVECVAHYLAPNNNEEMHTEDLRFGITPIFEGSKFTFPNTTDTDSGGNAIFFDSDQTKMLPAGNVVGVDNTTTGKFLIPKNVEDNHSIGVRVAVGVSDGKAMPNFDILFIEVHNVVEYKLIRENFSF